VLKEEKMARKDAQPGACDWTPARQPAGGENRSTLRRFADYGWDGVEAERYKNEEGGWAALTRQVLVGAHGESAPFEVRYFEIAPGGYSSLEKHRHEHVVIALRGQGEVLLGGELHPVGYLDVLYLAPDEPHQLSNTGSEPFGFLCLVSRERDRPRPLDQEELAALLASVVGSRLRL
jgi:quercetin dioxygenase-like cupin family protein